MNSDVHTSDGQEGEIREVAEQSEAGNARWQTASAAPAQASLVGVLEFWGKDVKRKGGSVKSDSDGSECHQISGKKERTYVLQVIAAILYD